MWLLNYQNMNILVLYRRGKADEAIRKYFRDQVEPQLEASKTGHVYELPMQDIEQIRQNMEQLQKFVEEKHIPLPQKLCIRVSTLMSMTPPL